MPEVIPVSPLSRVKIEQRALDFLRHDHPELIAKPGWYPAEALFDGPELENHGFTYAVTDFPPGCEGITDFISKECVLATSVYNQLKLQLPRARASAIHEFSHVLLHSNQINYAIQEGRSIVKMERSTLPSYIDPEWQANYMTAALMMPLPHMIELVSTGVTDPGIVMKLFGVSRQAAEIRLKVTNEFMQKNGPLVNRGHIMHRKSNVPGMGSGFDLPSNDKDQAARTAVGSQSLIPPPFRTRRLPP